MILPFQNDTREIEKKLARRNFKADKTRNIIAIIAITLTSILFTSLFTLGVGLAQSTQKANMILSGGDGHAEIVNMNQVEYDTISHHTLIQEIAYSRKLAESVDNQPLSKRNTQFWYYDDIALKYKFVEPTSGRVPQAENELITDTKTLELLGVPQKNGAEIALELTVHNQKITRNFVLVGWWESYPGEQHGTILASQAYVQAHAKELTDNFLENHIDTGTITGILKFESTQNVEADLDAVIEDSGYSMDSAASNYINAGVNPLYLSTEMSNEVGTSLALICVLLLFLLSGYLIIYNIFHISVLNDLHFYGLLKTLGTTGRQINSIIFRQMWTLSLMGIPLGLCAGFFIGKALLPVFMAQTAFAGGVSSISPNPLIFIWAAIFTFSTVFISIHKPAKMAANVSPIEALRYTTSDLDFSKRQKKRTRFRKPIVGMARDNLGRNKKRTVLVVLSFSLSIILANIVFNLSYSVNPEHAIKNMMNFDYSIGQTNLFNNYIVDKESALSEDFIQAVEKQDEFEIGGRQYGCKAAYSSETTSQEVNQLDDGIFSTHIYGLDTTLFSRLQLVDGELDAEKLATGAYILEGVYVSTRDIMDEDSINHSIGDKIKLNYNGSVREFTVLGHVVANEANTYDWVGSSFFLPSDVYLSFTGDTAAMSYNFDVAQGKEPLMDTFLNQYTNDVEPTMTYKSKSTIMAGVKDIQNIIVSVGGTIAFIIGIIGILNFINTILTGIFMRRRELAILQSVGMTRKQLVQMLCLEGCNYTFLSAFVSIPLSIISTFMIVRPMCEQIWFFDFTLNVWPLVIIFPLLFLMGIVIPCITYKIMSKQSVVERLECGE